MRASRRWQQLVKARSLEMERLHTGWAGGGEEFWNRARAERFAARVLDKSNRDPLLARLSRTIEPDSTLLDVGAGAGRLALPLAQHFREVIAVDASEAMLSILRREAQERRRDNIRFVLGKWEEVGCVTGDVAVCSHVLHTVEDAAGFLRKLDAATRHRVFVCLGALGPDFPFDPFWRYFHGKPRQPAPTYLDAAAVLEELGIVPTIEIAEVEAEWRYADVGEALAAFQDILLLPDAAQIRAELERLLTPWLTEQHGVVHMRTRPQPAAILSWLPRHKLR